ncbi:TM2 domain-containing protein [Corynebacterium choanae]|uniref:TM2 domain protein n=1 Tax=Corynebacterium choanae TaxID=1862358 RepID=A0A3G6JCB4_9CORY|nr:TM2 domain-containing protein [Corynebacterium choanae]AZA14698.1 TM2 domain protein [Corynebacterium choanae]
MTFPPAQGNHPSAEDEPDFFRSGTFDPAAAFDAAPNPGVQPPPQQSPLTPQQSAWPTADTAVPSWPAMTPEQAAQALSAQARAQVGSVPPAQRNIQQEIIDAARAEYATQSKNPLILWLLWLFVGIMGGHRFYLGHVGVGAAQLLTAGGCGIWWLIDAALIQQRLNEYNLRLAYEIGARYNLPPAVVALPPGNGMLPR